MKLCMATPPTMAPADSRSLKAVSACKCSFPSFPSEYQKTRFAASGRAFALKAVRAAVRPYCIRLAPAMLVLAVSQLATSDLMVVALV